MWGGFWFHHNNFAVPKVEKKLLLQGIIKANFKVEKTFTIWYLCKDKNDL